MPKFEKHLKTRIGTCRSGRPFDLPHFLQEDNLPEYLALFSADDCLDMFCMIEAVIALKYSSGQGRWEEEAIDELHSYFWWEENITQLRPKLEHLGLKGSPDYVRHGQMLLRH